MKIEYFTFNCNKFIQSTTLCVVWLLNERKLAKLNIFLPRNEYVRCCLVVMGNGLPPSIEQSRTEQSSDWIVSIILLRLLIGTLHTHCCTLYYTVHRLCSSYRHTDITHTILHKTSNAFSFELVKLFRLSPFAIAICLYLSLFSSIVHYYFTFFDKLYPFVHGSFTFII